MHKIKISSGYHTVIPKEIRRSLNLRVGQKLQIKQYGERIELIPDYDIKNLRGFLKGIKTDFEREKDRI